MRMTPLDVQSHQFAHRLRGYDPDEVKAFLRIVSEDYEGLVHETDSQNDRIRRLESRLEEEGAKVIRYKKPTFTKPAPIDLRHEIAEQCDAVVEALAD